jgi:hypothetical protein
MSGKNCATCAHATKKCNEEPCKKCYDDQAKGNRFPGWEPKK